MEGGTVRYIKLKGGQILDELTDVWSAKALSKRIDDDQWKQMCRFSPSPVSQALEVMKRGGEGEEGT